MIGSTFVLKNPCAGAAGNVHCLDVLEPEVVHMSSSGWWRALPLLAGALALAFVLGCDSGGGGDDSGGGEGGEDTTTAAGEDTLVPEDDLVDCVPACGTHVCGPDGCGGECGVCDAGLECTSGYCVEPPPDCDALCAGKECGWQDVCNCGECSGGLQCIGGACQEPMNCGETGFNQVVSQAKLDPHPAGGFYMHFQTLNQETVPFDVIVIELETDVGGPAGPGAVDAAYSSFNEHGIWLYMLRGWNGEGYQKLLIPSKGTINIASLSADFGAQFTATLEGVQLVEATYDPNSFAVNPVPHGDTWCLDGVVLDTQITQTQPDCVTAGTGQLLGDNIADFKLQNCHGEWVNLHDHCKQTKALWFVATAGW